MSGMPNDTVRLTREGPLAILTVAKPPLNLYADDVHAGLIAAVDALEADPPRGLLVRAEGINLLNSCGATAWQTVFHFHVHVIPRYAGDPLELPWVPGPGDPDEIRAAGEALRT